MTLVEPVTMESDMMARGRTMPIDGYAPAAEQNERRLQKKHWPRVIGLSGPAGSGKDLVGALLQMVGYEQVAFADELKIEIYDRLANPDVEILLMLEELNLCLGPSLREQR